MDRPVTRRRALRAAGVALSAALAGCSDRLAPGVLTDAPTDGAGSDPGGGTTPTTDAPDAVGLETVAGGFRAPLAFAEAPAADRRYLADQVGRIHVVGPDGRRERPFLDKVGSVKYGGERGLLGFALHPEFAENRRCFVRYSAPVREGTPSSYSHTFVLAEFRANDDGYVADPDSERTILEIPEPQGNHNAGDIAFGPDGHLYVTVGDGGGAGDRGSGHVEDWYDGVPGGNGQDVEENLLGSLLRIDVDGRGGGKPYAIPDDNPLVGRPGLDEHYAWGFRNPWRLSFDGADLYVADVGQNSWEEVDLVERGGNYGWNVREGAHCYDAGSCPREAPDGSPLRAPIIEYPHSGAPVSGISVIGGYVYRGSAVDGLGGAYVFADYVADGRLFVARPSADGGRWSTGVLPVSAGDRAKLGRILSFGRGRDDELYVLTVGDDGGALHRIVAAA